MSNQNNKIGFPLSPSSAAKSLANHQARNNNRSQLKQQHHTQQQFLPFQATNMPQNNIHNTSPLQHVHMENSPSSNFQQFQAENKSYAKQHQIMNAMYNQMNLRNTDLVKMSN